MKFVAAVLATLVVIAGVFATTRDNSEPALHVTADQPAVTPPGELDGSPLFGTSTTVPLSPVEDTTTTTTRPAKTTTTTTTVATTRTPVMTATDGAWELIRVDTGSRRCLELRIGASVSDRLLCDAASPADFWGDYATVITPTAMAVVGMVDRQVTGLSALMYEGVIAQVGADPSNPGLVYAVGVIKNLGGVNPRNGFDLFLRQGENTLGRAHISLDPGQHPAPPVMTTPPYGIWPGYSKVSSTGFWFGGNEDLGFYDNPSGDGSRCVLWRRLGGSPEAMLLDVCPSASDTVFRFAELRVEGPLPHLVRAAIVINAPRMTRWTCTWDNGDPCAFYGTEAMVLHDPAGSGLSFLPYFPGAFGRGGDRMTLTVYDGQTALGEIVLDVLPAR